MSIAVQRAFLVEICTSRVGLLLRIISFASLALLFVYSNRHHFKISFASDCFDFLKKTQGRELGALYCRKARFSELHGTAVSSHTLSSLSKNSHFPPQRTPWCHSGFAHLLLSQITACSRLLAIWVGTSRSLSLVCLAVAAAFSISF